LVRKFYKLNLEETSGKGDHTFQLIPVSLLQLLIYKHMPVIPALRRLRQEDLEFEKSLCYIERPYL
jgi:hypothetical protein